MERSELSITFEKYRNIGTRTSISLFTGDPLAYTVVSHHPSSFLHQPNVFHSCSSSPQPGLHWPSSGTAGFGPNTVFSPTSSKTGGELGPICSLCLSGCKWGKESHCCTSGTSDGEMGSSLVLLLAWDCESESHTKDMQSWGKSVSLICWFAKNNYFPLLLKISEDYSLLKKTNRTKTNQQTQKLTLCWP